MRNAKMIVWIGILALLAILLTACQAHAGQENCREDHPWEKAGASLGVFWSSLNANFRIGSGIGVDIDVEEALDLDTSDTVFRAEALWRFTDNRRHRLDLMWFSFKRDGSRHIGQDIIFEDENGNPVVIEAGTQVDSFFDLDIYELTYSYSFFQDERLDLAAGFGFYVMPIDLGLRAGGLIEAEGSQNFTSPLLKRISCAG